MKISLGDLATMTISELKGDPGLILEGVNTLDDAGESEISFVSNPKYLKSLKSTQAAAVILPPDLTETYSGNILVNADPYLTFAKVVYAFHAPQKAQGGIHPAAIISAKAELGDNLTIEANVVIEEGASIGDNCVIKAGSFVGANTSIGKGGYIHPNVTLYADTLIGARSIIHSGTVIGSDGFGFAPQKDKSWFKILQVGNVVIGDDVEIGACTAIDRAALGSTRIGKGVKLDNQVQIAHNVEIGDHTVMAGGSMVAGSTKIGAYCQIGGQAGIAGHLTIVDGVIITGRGMVTGSIKKPGVYSSGIPLDDNRRWRRNVARFRHLDEMAKTLKKIEKQIDQ